MTYSKWLARLALIGALALVASACNGDDVTEPTEPGEPVEEATCPEGDECVEIASGDPIKIGTQLVITGENASLGLDSQHGAELAVDYRSGAFDGTPGEIHGHPIELDFEDDGCSAEGGTTGARRLASDPEIVGVVGTSCSSAGEPAAQIFSDAGIVLISPSNTAPSLTAPETHQEYYLRTAHNDAIQGAAMAQFAAEELGVTSAATIHDGSPYAEQLQQVFADTFESEYDGEITAQEAIAPGDTDFVPVLTSIAAGNPELIYYPIFVAEGGLITSQARTVGGLEGVELAGADGMFTPDWVEAAGADNAEGVYLSGPDLDFAGDFYRDEFLPAYNDAYGEPTAVFHAHSFDATNILLDAIEEVAIQTDDGGLLIPRVALKDRMFETSGFDGVIGTLDCGESDLGIGDCNPDATIAVAQVRDGDFEVIWP
jgi:branched-chain amino acid transport system substrate-binding protein